MFRLAVLNPLQLLEVRLAVVPGAGRDVRIQNHATVGGDTLMDLVLELSRRASPANAAELSASSSIIAKTAPTHNTPRM